MLPANSVNNDDQSVVAKGAKQHKFVRRIQAKKRSHMKFKWYDYIEVRYMKY